MFTMRIQFLYQSLHITKHWTNSHTLRNSLETVTQTTQIHKYTIDNRQTSMQYIQLTSLDHAWIAFLSKYQKFKCSVCKLRGRLTHKPCKRGCANCAKAICSYDETLIPRFANTIGDTDEQLTVPSVPTNIQLVDKMTDGALTISWTAPTNNGHSNITGYIVKVYNTTTVESQSNVSATPLSVDISDLTNLQTYYATVSARNAVGTSDPSQVSETSAPSGPLQGSHVSENSNNISITDI